MRQPDNCLIREGRGRSSWREDDELTQDQAVAQIAHNESNPLKLTKNVEERLSKSTYQVPLLFYFPVGLSLMGLVSFLSPHGKFHKS
jgi:hypothetical protein